MGIVVSLLKEAVKTLVGHDIFLFVLNNFRKENLEAAEVRSISSKDMEVRSISSKDMGSQTAMLGSVSFKLGNSKSDTDISDGLKQKDSDASPVGSESNKENNKDAAAVKVQKVYRSYRTRRNLADCAVVAEELWWQAIDFVTLKRNTVSFFDIGKPETAVARWSRAGLKAAKVGKGLSKDENARKLAFQHWMEAIDPRHRYGHNLHFYYDAWFESDTMQPFFYWLDIGDGKGLDLQNLCPRSKLQNHRIKYLGPKEREHYEFIPENGKLVYKQSGQLVDTSNGSEGLKWIFVMSTSKKLYVGQKKKGTFQHSSFLAGGATSAAGRFTVENGILKAIWPHSGHYLPTEQNFTELLNFLEENGIDLSNVEKGTYETASPELERDRSSEKLEGNVQSEAYIEKDDKKNDTAFCDYEQNGSEDKSRDSLTFSQLANENETSNSDDNVQPTISHESSMTEQSTVGTEILKTGEERENQGYLPHNRSVSGELEIEKPEIHHTELLKRFNSKKAIQSYQLGKQLSLKWSSGAGPRIGCVADYPAELRAMALERVNLSPRCASPSSYKLPDCMTPSSNRTPKPTSPSGYKLPKCLTPSSNQSPKGKPPLIIPSPRFKSPLLIPSPMCKSPLLIPSPMCKSPLLISLTNVQISFESSW